MLDALDEALKAAGIPIEGVSILDGKQNPPLVRVDCKSCTPRQHADADAIVAAFDWSEPAQRERETVKHREQTKAALDPGVRALLAALVGIDLKATTEEELLAAVMLAIDEGKAD